MVKTAPKRLDTTTVINQLKSGFFFSLSELPAEEKNVVLLV